MTIKNLLCCWIAGLLIVVAGCSEKTPPPQKEVPLIPMRDFFRNPEKTGFKISPNGEYQASNQAANSDWPRCLPDLCS